MKEEMLKSLFSPIITLIGILLTQFFVNKTQKKTNRTAIFEQQYKTIFAPIQKILLFSNEENPFYKIKKQVEENFELLPNQLTETFKECLIKKQITNDFIQQIELGYIRLNNGLGYSHTALKNEKVKFSNESIKLGNNVLKQSIKTFIAALIIVTLSFVVSIINSFYNNILPNYIFTLINIFAFVVELFPFLLYFFKVFIKYIKYNLNNNI